MLKRTDLHKILIIGSGLIVIGQACNITPKPPPARTIARICSRDLES